MRILLCLLILLVSINAQQAEPILVDEFGVTNCDDYRGRLDILLIELEKAPGAKGVVFVYSGDLELDVYDKNSKKVGVRYVRSMVELDRALINYYKNHVLFRHFSPDRLEFVRAGYRRKFTNTFWLVPKGSAAPIPTPTLKSIKQKRKPKDLESFCDNP